MRVHIVHQIAKHAALAAAGGDHALGRALLDVVNALAGLDRSGPHLPVDGDGLDVMHGTHQTLVAQKAQHQQLGMPAQRHQRHQLALVHINGERPFAGNGAGHRLTPFVDSP